MWFLVVKELIGTFMAIKRGRTSTSIGTELYTNEKACFAFAIWNHTSQWFVPDAKEVNSLHMTYSNGKFFSPIEDAKNSQKNSQFFQALYFLLRPSTCKRCSVQCSSVGQLVGFAGTRCTGYTARPCCSMPLSPGFYEACMRLYVSMSETCLVSQMVGPKRLAFRRSWAVFLG